MRIHAPAASQTAANRERRVRGEDRDALDAHFEGAGHQVLGEVGGWSVGAPHTPFMP